MKDQKISNNSLMVIITGIVIGIFGALLVKFGNPGNMGVCVACFLRDITGSLGLHRASVVQYIRPEIIGFVLGAFIVSLLAGEFKARGGSSSITRFLLGAFVMIGALVFLGCPVRMLLRLGGGDLNSLTALIGFIIGIYIGVLFLKKGFTLGRSNQINKTNGYVLPLLMLSIFILLLVKPSFIFISEKGPGSMHAPIIISIIAGLIIGGLAQRSRFCFVGGIRDVILIRSSHLLIGFIIALLLVFIVNLALGQFSLGFSGQFAAHSNHLWNLLGMLLVGISATLLGGCPLRQLILTGEGDCDSAVTVLGFVAGAAVAHNFILAASPEGVPLNGQIAVIIGIVICLVVGFINREK
ncbi:MAG: YedE family putative selenium transporter [bacterium]|nr:YedE family putative selenium transporter [bacterium]